MPTPRRDGVSLRQVVLLAVVVGVISYAGLSLWVGSGHRMPPVAWPGIVVPVGFAVLVLVLGNRVRRTVAGTAEKPLEPIGASRVLLAAQAGAATGACAIGWYGAQLVRHLPDADVASVRSAVLILGGYVVSGLILCAAGLQAQRWCRIDPADRDDS